MKNTLICLIIISLSSACSKSGSDNGGCERSVATLSGSYRLVKFETKVLNNFVDITRIAIPDTCQWDDKIELYPDSSAAYTDLGLICTTPQPVTTGSWKVYNNNLDLRVGAYNIIGANIDYFNCTRLMITYNYTTTTSSGTVNSTVRLTMTQ